MNVIRRRLFLLCGMAAIALVCATSSAPVRAFEKLPGPLTIRWDWQNSSDKCAWVTTYWSYKSEAHWRIVSGSTFWVAPGKTGRYTQETFNQVTLTPQLRFRAEFPGGAACSGSDGRNSQTQGDFRRRTPVELRYTHETQRFRVHIKRDYGLSYNSVG